MLCIHSGNLNSLFLLLWECLHVASALCRASQGEKAENSCDSQVLQYEPAHHGSVNTVTNLSPDLCVSGGTDQVGLNPKFTHVKELQSKLIPNYFTFITLTRCFRIFMHTYDTLYSLV